jgi:hypothetical protein
MNERDSIANMRFAALTSSIIAAFSLLVVATPTPEVCNTTFTITAHCSLCLAGQFDHLEQFKDWLDKTESDVTFIGKRLGDLSDLSKRNALDTVVIFCNSKVGNVCGGTCTVYSGGPACIPALGTNCLSATKDVGFCDRLLCDGGCSQYSATASDCGSNGACLENNFCSTPNTDSVNSRANRINVSLLTWIC